MDLIVDEINQHTINKFDNILDKNKNCILKNGSEYICVYFDLDEQVEKIEYYGKFHYCSVSTKNFQKIIRLYFNGISEVEKKIAWETIYWDFIFSETEKNFIFYELENNIDIEKLIEIINSIILGLDMKEYIKIIMTDNYMSIIRRSDK